MKTTNRTFNVPGNGQQPDKQLTPDSRKKGRKKQHFGGEINNKNFQFKSNRKTAYAL